MGVRSAAELLAAHLALIGKDLGNWLMLLAGDAVVEFPYAASLGYPRRLEGKPAIAAYMRDVLAGITDLKFSHLRTFTTKNPDVVFAEFTGEARVASTGRNYRQEYIVRLEARNGEIVYYREYWNPVEVLNAFDREKLRSKSDVATRPVEMCE